MQKSSAFAGVSMLVVGDFFELPPGNQKSLFTKPSKGSFRSFNGPLWETFQLPELVKIVRQSSDPEFAQLLNRV